MRRSQIVWSSSQQETARKIAKRLGCDDETVRKVIKQFNAQGLQVLQTGSRRPHKTAAKFSDECAEELKEILHQSPRRFGQETSLWTLALLAKISYENGLVKSLISIETMSATLERFGIEWARAKHWITSPDADYLHKKRRDRLMGLLKQQPDWAFGFEDETWWSRLSHPDLHSWVENGTFLKLVEQNHHKDDPGPKAIACYGLYVRWADPTRIDSEHVWLRFVEGNPCSKLTNNYLEWLDAQLQASGKRVLVMFWDYASWHISKMVRSWLHAHNREVKKTGQGIRFLICMLPKKSPWLNPIEPMWIHAKRKVVEPNRKLSADELVNRVCAVFEHPVLPFIKISENVS